MSRFIGTSLLLTYSTGLTFGMAWYHKKINKYAFSQEIISTFDKYLVSFDEHLKIGHRFGFAFIKVPFNYILYNKSFEDTIEDIKLPFYFTVAMWLVFCLKH